MHDRVRLAVEHSRADGPRVEQVDSDRFGAEHLQQLPTCW
jgi:hypothetical protein